MSDPEKSLPTSAGEFQVALIEYIKERWGDLLGNHLALLDEEDGIDRLTALLRSGALEEGRSTDPKSPLFSI